MEDSEFTNLKDDVSGDSACRKESSFQPAQTTISVKNKVRDWLRLPKHLRPTQTTLAKECGVTPQYISKAKLECERELKLQRREKNPLYQMQQMQKHIAAGDAIVGENYESLVRKLIAMAKDGNVKAAHLLLDSVISHYRQQPQPVPAEGRRTLSPTVAIAFSMVPAAKGKTAEQIMIEYHGDITPEEQEEIVRRRAEWEARANAYNDGRNHPVRSSARQLAGAVDIEVDNSQQDE